MPEQRATTLRWAVIVAMKPLTQAKSRLDLPAPKRRELAVAMLNDTLAAAGSCRGVRNLIMITADAELASTAHHVGAEVFREPTAEGLNTSFRVAAEQVQTVDGTLSLALLPADLPAATSAELELALMRAERFPSAVLPDSNHVGTVLLAVAAGMPMALRFGPESYRAHRSAGAQPINVHGLGGLRRDVDTLNDLNAARQIGLGRHTASVVDRLVPYSLHRRDHHGLATALSAGMSMAGRR